MDTPQWRALLRAEIQSGNNKLNKMAQRQMRRCEVKAKQQEAREYLLDKKGPSKFCGKIQSTVALEKLAHEMTRGIF